MEAPCFICKKYTISTDLICVVCATFLVNGCPYKNDPSHKNIHVCDYCSDYIRSILPT